MLSPDWTQRRTAFHKLHESGCFVIPNPWDIGTAVYLAHLGFPALATTSAGFAFSQGRPDADWAVPLSTALEHIAAIVGATELPVNADFQSGYAHEPENVAANVRLCIDTGVAGLSIEDATGRPEKPLYDVLWAADRIKAVRRTIDDSNSGVLLTARAECYLVGHPDPLHESIRRLQAYAEAGADVLYAPGPQRAQDIKTIVSELHPKPVNVLMSSNIGLRVKDIAEMGARRISVGSSLARAAWGAFIRAARAIADEGTFAGFDQNIPLAELNSFFLKSSKEGL
jgi:2-methylisocitrate lyase-like PEP mutase family enzyme